MGGGRRGTREGRVIVKLLSQLQPSLGVTSWREKGRRRLLPPPSSFLPGLVGWLKGLFLFFGRGRWGHLAEKDGNTEGFVSSCAKAKHFLKKKQFNCRRSMLRTGYMGEVKYNNFGGVGFLVFAKTTVYHIIGLPPVRYPHPIS